MFASGGTLLSKKLPFVLEKYHLNTICRLLSDFARRGDGPESHATGTDGKFPGMENWLQSLTGNRFLPEKRDDIEEGDGDYQAFFILFILWLFLYRIY